MFIGPYMIQLVSMGYWANSFIQFKIYLLIFILLLFIFEQSPLGSVDRDRDRNREEDMSPSPPISPLVFYPHEVRVPQSPSSCSSPGSSSSARPSRSSPQIHVYSSPLCYSSSSPSDTSTSRTPPGTPTRSDTHTPQTPPRVSDPIHPCYIQPPRQPFTPPHQSQSPRFRSSPLSVQSVHSAQSVASYVDRTYQSYQTPSFQGQSAGDITYQRHLSPVPSQSPSPHLRAEEAPPPRALRERRRQLEVIPRRPRPPLRPVVLFASSPDSSPARPGPERRSRRRSGLGTPYPATKPNQSPSHSSSN